MTDPTFSVESELTATKEQLSRVKAELEKRFVTHDPFNCQYVAEGREWKQKAERYEVALKDIAQRADGIKPAMIDWQNCVMIDKYRAKEALKGVWNE